MSKVITFSRVSPKYHPKAGQPTYFVEKIVQGLHKLGDKPWDIDDAVFSEEMYYICEPKYHTIRAGNRWKVGDKFSPRVWSGKPYASKQIIIAPDIEIKKIWEFEINHLSFYINGKIFYTQHRSIFHSHMEELCKNDGLSFGDLLDWFKVKMENKENKFNGQIICWNENINY